MLRGTQPFILAIALVLCLARAAGSPIEGTWEATQNGKRAVTLTIARHDGLLSGSAVFYILRDSGDGEHNGSAQPAVPVKVVEWDGKTLRFSVTGPDGEVTPFELKLTGEDTAELRTPGARDAVPAVRRTR